MFSQETLFVDLNSNMAISLSQPSKFFNKLAALTRGGLTPREQERIKAFFAVLQKINSYFRKMGITDIVSLHIDDDEIYRDHHNNDTDDIRLTMKALEDSDYGSQDKLFSSITLVLRHSHENTVFSFVIKLSRGAEKGVAPLKISTNSIPKTIYNATPPKGTMTQLANSYKEQSSLAREKGRLEYDAENFGKALINSITADEYFIAYRGVPRIKRYHENNNAGEGLYEDYDFDFLESIVLFSLFYGEALENPGLEYVGSGSEPLFNIDDTGKDTFSWADDSCNTGNITSDSSDGFSWLDSISDSFDSGFYGDSGSNCGGSCSG